MNRNDMIWVLESCFLTLDHNFTKEDLIKFGCPKELAEMGIQLYSYLIKKKLLVEMEIKNGF